MKPYYEDTKAGIVLYHGDCLALVPLLQLPPVAAVVTDPPFGVREDEWDDMENHEFARFSMAWLSAVRRVSNRLVSFCSCYGPFRALCEMLYPRVQVCVWEKPLGSQYAGGREFGLWLAHETVLHGYQPVRSEVVTPKSLRLGRLIRDAREAAGFSRGAVEIAIRGKKTGLCYRWEEGACLPTPEQVKQLRRMLPLGPDFEGALADACADRDRTLAKAREAASERAARWRDVFSHRTEAGAEHPCQKPLPLMAEIVQHFTAAGELVFDPFAGSGTTLRAAKDAGRRAVGIELSERYCEMAARRLEQGVLQFTE